MGKTAQIITIANQKGGCGKSTTTTFFANALHKMGYKIAVIDSDYQRSIFKMRDLEIDNDSSIDSKSLYTILYTPPTKVLDLIKSESEKYDFIFCDIPGNITENGVIGILSRTDLVIVIHDVNSVGLASTMDFLDNLKKGVIEVIEKLGYDPPRVINLIARLNENLKLHKMFLKQTENISDFPWFKHHIRDLQSTFGDISTIYPYSHPKYDYEFELIIKEFLSIFK